MTTKLRIWLVIRIVRFVAHWWDRAYDHYCDKQRRRERLCVGAAIDSEKLLFPIARRLDIPGENWMGAEMAEHSWWG